MTTIINNTFNFNFGGNGSNASSFGGLSPIQSLAGQLTAAIFATFTKPLGASPFASAQLPSQFQFQLGSSGAQGFQPTGDAMTATLSGNGKGSIDLGDGYSLTLDENNSEATIHNANTGEDTQIWGDPHVNVDGKHAFDFYGTTTFELNNGTKITINTEQSKSNPDVYYSNQLTITKGDQAIQVNGLSEQTKGDLSISQSSGGRAIDAATRDGYVLEENAGGSGWNSELTGQLATQADLNLTKPGQIYGPGSDMPSLGEISQSLSSFLLMGAALMLAGAALDGASAR